MPDQQLDSRGKPRADFQTVFKDESRTIQSDAHHADIKNILKKYKEVGIVDHLNITQSSFQDVTTFTDFADVIRTAKAAEAEFMKLPSKVREIFNHDVAIWLDTAHDEEKRAALAERGEIEPQQQPTETNPGDNPPGNEGEGTSGPNPS